MHTNTPQFLNKLSSRLEVTSEFTNNYICMHIIHTHRTNELNHSVIDTIVSPKESST